MIRVLLIEDDADARAHIRDGAPDDWEICEAADGLRGLDLVREQVATLDLVILDMRLPDVDGEYLCAQIRDLSRSLPILPYTAKEAALPLLADLACLPPIIKPTGTTRLREALLHALSRPTPAVVESGALGFVRAESYRLVQEQRTRMSGRRIVVIAHDDYLRSWLSQLISPVVSAIRAENPAALRKILETLHITAIVADAAIAALVAPLTRTHGLPLILVATTPAQARGLGSIEVHRLFLSSDPKLGTKLRAVIDGLSGDSDDDGWLLDEPPAAGSIMPADMLRRFADTPLSQRQLEVLWLEHQGLTRAQIAAELAISPATVSTHWKNVQAQLRLDRSGVQRWFRAHLSA